MKVGVAGEGVFHFSRARFELGQQVAVPAFEILQYVVEEACGRVGIHREHPAHDMVGALPVGRVEVPRLGSPAGKVEPRPVTDRAADRAADG